MKDLKIEDVKSLLQAIGTQVPEDELPLLTVRINGLLGLFEKLRSLPLEQTPIIPTLLTQRKD